MVNPQTKEFDMATAKKAAGAKVQDTPAAVDWNKLPEAEAVEYTRVTGGKPSIADTTPQVVKDRVEAAYQESVATGKAVFKAQALPSVEAAQEFARLMRRWARSIGRTVKGTPEAKITEGRFVYAVVDGEKRPRKAVEKP